MKRPWIVIIAVLLVLAFAVPSMLAKSRVINPKISRRATGAFGGTLVSSAFDPKTFNYLTSNDQSSSAAVQWIYEGFTELNGVTTAIEPALAEKWTFSKDGLVWTFFLRKGVTWHDGRPFTADDVIFTLDMVYDERIPTSNRDVLMVNGKRIKYEKVDAHTVKIILPEPFAPLLGQIPDFMPKHRLHDAWKAGKFNEMHGIDTDPGELVGTGPWRCVEYKTGERLVYERNKNYWIVNSNGQSLPYLDRWIVLMSPNLESQTLKFRSNETDFQSVRAEEWKLYQDGQKAGNYTCYDAGPTFDRVFFTFNQNPKAPWAKSNPAKLKWFQNKAFRQAMAYAVDHNAIIRNVYRGLATFHYSAISAPNKVYLNTRIRKYEYNLGKAESLLASAGFRKGNDGVLRDAQGNVVKFTFSTNPENSQRVMMTNTIAEDMRKLGVQVTVAPISFNLLIERLMNTYDWDCILLSIGGGNPDPVSMQNVWHSSGQLHMWNPVQEKPATEWEKRIDELLEIGPTIVNLKERVKVYGEFQAIAAEECPMIMLPTPNRLYAVRNRLGNVVPATFGGVLHNNYEFFVR